jgi:hypothetical protein
MYVDTVERSPTLTPRPRRAQERDGMSPLHESAENFVEMNLCPSGLRVLPIEPIENEDLHTRNSEIR